METATQPSFFDNVGFIETAKKRYPHSFKHGRVRGDGPHVLVAKCTIPWRVFCFADAQQRADTLDKWSWNGCGSARCSYNHVCEELE